MSNRVIAALVGAFILLLLLLNSFFVVNEREQAIVTRFGQIQAVHEEPGLHFKAPFSFAGFDNVQMIEDRLLRADLDDIRVQTSGGRFYQVNAFITYEIDDPIRFRQAASGDVELARNRLETRFEDAVRGVYGRRGFEAALSDARAEMMREVSERLRPDAESLGLRIADVRIRRTDLTQEVSAQTYQRMNAERFAEAERLRARGREAARRIMAAANRQVVEIRAEAQREAEVLRGEGEGQRNRIFAEAVSRDPQFYDFLRSLALYRESLQGEGTSMVLSPNSEFFRYEEFARRFGDSPAPSPTPAVDPAAPSVDPSAAPGDDDTVVVPIQPATPDNATPDNATPGTAAPADQ